MQKIIFGRFAIFAVCSGMVFVPVFFWITVLHNTGFLTSISGYVIPTLLLVLVIVVLFELLQRVANFYHVKHNRLEKIQNTGQHTLLVMAISLATKMNIPIPNMVVKDEYGCNAMLVPLFGNSALFINDELINALTPDELKAVIAHEYAHIFLGHVATMSWLNSLLQISLVIPAKLLSAIFNPLFMLFRAGKYTYTVFSIVMLITHCGFLFVYINYLNREFERQADRQAIRHVSPELLIKALKALQHPGSLHHNIKTWHVDELSRITPFYRLLRYFHSHPSVSARIHLLEPKE